MQRSELIHILAQQIDAIDIPHPVRVAIDGVDTAGKTTLANELAHPLEAIGRAVIRASIDDFHNPAEVRHRRGSTSPEGYYYDSFDYRQLVELLLHPLGQNGNRLYRRSIYDFRSGSSVESDMERTSPDAILLFDGVFLLRPELHGYWDFSIFLHVDFETVLHRAKVRDLDLFGSVETVNQRYEQRYIPGQKLYLAVARPESRASVVIDNTNPEDPTVIAPQIL
jgi:uridine kinase